MTAALAPQPFVSVDEYLFCEAESDVRHEYANGQVFAVAGASADHELLVGAIVREMGNYLKGKPCKVTPSNLKLRIELNHADLFYYPDAMVWCDTEDNDRLFKRSPKVIVEVMSDYKTDHVEKLLAYQQVDALEDYLVVDQDFEKPKAWLYRRAADWKPIILGAGEMIELASIDFSIPLDALYED
ncbi:MAG: Uma2 family endonuclease [Verrucomicrobiota bacterium]